MFALPPDLDASGRDRVTGVACPECPGVLQVRVEGVHGHLRFECRIGHGFSTDGLLAGKEKIAEDRVWAAALAFEEMAALLEDLDAYAVAHERARMDTSYQERAARSRQVASALRHLVERDQPIRMAWPTGRSAPDGA